MCNVDRLREVVVAALMQYGLRRVALFGSLARGEEHEGSDIDLLVDFSETRTRPLGLIGLQRLERELERRLGRPVELVTGAALKPRIRQQIEAEMIVLYEAS